MADQWAYSTDEEHYHGEFDTKEGAIQEATDEVQGVEETRIWVAKTDPPDITNHFDGNIFIERLAEDLMENELAFVDLAPCDLITVDDKSKFEEEIKAVIKNHLSTAFWGVRDAEEIVISEKPEEIDNG